MLTALLTFLTGLPGMLSGLFGSINHVTDALSNERIAAISAKTQAEQIAAQEWVNTLTLKRDTMIAEAVGSKLNIRIRAALAFCVLPLLAKIFIWDKTIGPFYGCVGKVTAASCKMFDTDALDPNLWQVVMVIVGFYFLSEAAAQFKRK